MLIHLLLGYLSVMAWFLAAGWHWQATKSPETQHLELLIDLNDPYAVEYAAKIWGEETIEVVPEVTTSKWFALL